MGLGMKALCFQRFLASRIDIPPNKVRFITCVALTVPGPQRMHHMHSSYTHTPCLILYLTGRGDDKANLASLLAGFATPYNQNILKSWDPNTDPCTSGWGGVTCDSTSGLVTKITLGGNLFTGTIPAQLGLFTGIVTLDFSGALFNGTLPASLSTMTSLMFADLHGNTGLTSTIPAAFSAMTALTFLDLRNSNLTGTIPPELGALTSLTYLGLAFNKLGGKCDLNSIPISSPIHKDRVILRNGLLVIQLHEHPTRIVA